jgi:hypothetical protein
MNVGVIYLILILIWIAIIIFLKLYETNWVGLIILLIPVIIFGIATLYQDEHLVSNHTLTDDDDFLTIGIILLLPLLTYFDKDYDGNKARFMGIIITSLFLFLLSVIPMWIPVRFAKYLKILRTSIQTIAITLLLYVIHLYYTHRCNNLFSKTLLFDSSI